MISFETFREIALSFSGANEQPHFEKTSFRIRKKIFATYDFQQNSASLKLNETDQSVFSDLRPSAVFPVPNKWGRQGWTIFKLAMIDETMFSDALSLAYENILITL